jgi:hypothetical protein
MRAFECLKEKGEKKGHNLASHSQKQPTLFSFFIEKRRADEFIDRRKSRPRTLPMYVYTCRI